MQAKLTKINKSFGDKHVLNDIDFTAESGVALGLLGRNGAGKTTILRILTEVFPPDSGTVTFDGKELSKSKVKIGYLPEERGMYPKKQILEQLLYLGELKGMKKRDAKLSAEKLIARLDMSEYMNKKLLTLSKGNQQKIQLAATLINNPDVIILDEPFSGLDPVNAVTLEDIIKEELKNGKIVIFSSHQMSHVENFCDTIAIIDKGEIVRYGNLREIKRSYDRTKTVISYENEAIAAKSLQSLISLYPNIIKTASSQGDKIMATLKKAEDRKEFITKIIEFSDPEAFSVEEPSLQDIFVESVGESK